MLGKVVNIRNIIQKYIFSIYTIHKKKKKIIDEL
jgi:hypothetical protein